MLRGGESSSASTGREFTPKIVEKRWSKEIEKEILEAWNKEDLYKFDPEKPGPILVIDTPPPYPSGK